MGFYVIPMTGAGTKADPRREKYVYALGVDRAIVDLDDMAIVWARTTPEQEAALALNSDVTVVPPLDNAINVAAVTTFFEAHSIPAQWLTASMTYRQVLKVLIGMAQLIHRTENLGFKFKLAGNLDRTLGSLSASVQQALIDAATQLGLDQNGITGATTVREALRIMGQRFIARYPVNLGEM